MPEYIEWRAKKLAVALAGAAVEPEVAEAILAGGEELSNDSPVADKMAWLEGAMGRLEAALDPCLWHAVRERCACCLGGKRLQQSRAIARDHGTLAERVAAANAAPFVFGHSVEQLDDDRFRVCFFPDDWEHYPCGCFPKPTQALPLSYCYCCGGHVKHHLQKALGLKLDVEVKTSALASGGTERCVFELTRAEGR